MGHRTFKGLSHWGVGHCNTVSQDLTLLVIGHHKQQVTGLGNGHIVIATLVYAVRRPCDIK